MVGLEVKTVNNKQEWEDFLTSHPEANFLQSWQWGEFHKNLGKQIIRLSFYKNDQLVGVMLAIVEPAKRGRHLVVPGGPIIDWHDQALVQTWATELKRAGRQQGCIFSRVRPQISNNESNRRIFKQLGFSKAPMHLHAELTTQLDLTKSDAELKSAMRKGTKYELNRAAKLGIQTEAASDGRYLDEFYELQLATAERQKFVPFSKKFLTEQFKVFAQDNQVIMYRATHQGRLLAMAFVIFYGQEAAYHYGASTPLAREIPGAYAIQAAAIAEARRRGQTRYNFWGVTEHGQTKHRFYGVSVFKRGFGGDDIAYLPAHDLVINKLKYSATYLFETARRHRRHL